MWLRWLPVVLWIAVILGLSSIPNLGSAPAPFPGVDKLVHMSEFAILGFLLARALRIQRRPVWKIVLRVSLCGVLIGGADEWYQLHVPGRMSDLYDVVADVLGTTLGGLFWLYLQRRHATADDFQRSR
jgi:VanZ family protein